MKTVIDEWVGGLGPPLAQWEVMRLVSPLNEEVVGPLPFGPFLDSFSFLILYPIYKKISLAKEKAIRRFQSLAFFLVAFLRLFWGQIHRRNKKERRGAEREVLSFFQSK